MGFGLVIGFIDDSQVVTTIKCNTLADSHTTNHSTLNLLSELSLVFTIRFLTTALSQSHGNFKYHCNYSICTVFSSHTKSSCQSVIPFLPSPSTANYLNSNLRLSLFWLNSWHLTLWYISFSSGCTIHWNYSDFQLNSQSKSKLCYDRRLVGQSVLE
jgi:hypothetical protein